MKRFSSPVVAIIAATAGCAALVVTVVAIAQAREAEQWRWDDWAAVAVTSLVGALFGVLAWIVGRRQGQLTQGVANVTLREKAGAIGTDSLRVLSGPLDLSLHIGRDALSAMPLFTIAESSERELFAREVVRGYSSLLLNCFPRTSAMPLGSIRRLRDDGERLCVALRDVNVAVSPRAPVAVGDFIKTCLDIEEAGRRFAQEGAPTSIDDLPQNFLRTVYSSELLVYHNWAADHMNETQHRLELQRGMDGLVGYFAPWYLSSDGTAEVDYTGTRRTDSRTHSPEDTRHLNSWRTPLTHAEVLSCPGYRQDFIARMQLHLASLTTQHASVPSFALLAYELPDGSRMILDGNHRLAAALRVREAGPPPLVYVFVVREGHAAPASTVQDVQQADGTVQEFRGFNPDIDLLRDATAAPAP